LWFLLLADTTGAVEQFQRPKTSTNDGDFLAMSMLRVVEDLNAFGITSVQVGAQGRPSPTLFGGTPTPSNSQCLVFKEELLDSTQVDVDDSSSSFNIASDIRLLNNSRVLLTGGKKHAKPDKSGKFHMPRQSIFDAGSSTFQPLLKRLMSPTPEPAFATALLEVRLSDVKLGEKSLESTKVLAIALSGASHLKVLDLSFNSLCGVVYPGDMPKFDGLLLLVQAISRCKKLEVLSLAGTGLVGIPYSVCSQGLQEVTPTGRNAAATKSMHLILGKMKGRRENKNLEPRDLHTLLLPHNQLTIARGHACPKDDTVFRKKLDMSRDARGEGKGAKKAFWAGEFNVKALNTLAEVIKDHPSLIDINLSHNWLGLKTREGVIALANAISVRGERGQPIEALKLSNSALIGAVSSSLTEQFGLHEEGFNRPIKKGYASGKRNKATKSEGGTIHSIEGLLALSRAIHRGASLKVFDLSWNKIGFAGASGMHLICNAVGNLPLEEIHLEGNYFKREFRTLLARKMLASSKIESLACVSCDQFSFKANVLELNLRACRLVASDLMLVASFVQSATILQKLLLSSNRLWEGCAPNVIDLEGLQHFVEALRTTKGTRLVLLDISDNAICASRDAASHSNGGHALAVPHSPRPCTSTDQWGVMVDLLLACVADDLCGSSSEARPATIKQLNFAGNALCLEGKEACGNVLLNRHAGVLDCFKCDEWFMSAALSGSGVFDVSGRSLKPEDGVLLAGMLKYSGVTAIK
jgi:hypothetical protein